MRLDVEKLGRMSERAHMTESGLSDNSESESIPMTVGLGIIAIDPNARLGMSICTKKCQSPERVAFISSQTFFWQRAIWNRTSTHARREVRSLLCTEVLFETLLKVKGWRGFPCL